MFQAAADGEIKALWIACTNPAQSMPDQATVRRALERAEFVVVQEAFATATTCDFADLLLPATTWGEKDWHGDQQRTPHQRACAAAVSAAGRGPPRLAPLRSTVCAPAGKARLRPGQPTLFPYTTDDADQGAETVWNEHRESTRVAVTWTSPVCRGSTLESARPPTVAIA